MRVLSATSFIAALVLCTADDIEPRWSRPDDEMTNGEWVPLKRDQINQQPIRIPSAITASRYNHERAFPHPSPTNQFDNAYTKQQTVASPLTAPQRVAFVNPQNLDQQQIVQHLKPQLQQQLQPQIQPQLRQQVDPQQLLAHFLNQQIQQTSLPIFNRGLLQKQSIPNPQYFTQPNQFNIIPAYNQDQSLPTEQYIVSDPREINSKVLSKDVERQSLPGNNYKELHELPNKKYITEPFNSNISSNDDSHEKEEIQILYVPVEMLKQEQAVKNKVGKNTELNQPLREIYNSEFQQKHPEISQINSKETNKFRHPIQPLKEQVPTYRIKQSHQPDKTVYPNAETINEEIKQAKPLFSNQDHTNHKTQPQSRGHYSHKYDSSNRNSASSPTNEGKEQSVDESTIKDEISDYRHSEHSRINHNDHTRKIESSLPPPNQPPLSVFMEKTASNRDFDLITLLRGSKTIPVLESIGPNSPEVFVGPSNLHTPSGYLKYELPYLSSLDNYQTGNKLSQVPFFVAPLNFQPPPGFAKIPFPPPHIGSVVLSNITQQALSNQQLPIAQSNTEQQTNNNKGKFTIPSDISSISPQLPSLINSLQEEEEYSTASSTETLIESTETTPSKQRRPNSSRRFNSRGSQRGSVSYGSTTKRPSSRQRKPLNRNSNYRTNHYTEVATNIPESTVNNHYDTEGNIYPYKTNKDIGSTERDIVYQNSSENPYTINEDRNHKGAQYSSIEDTNDEENSKKRYNPVYTDHNPTYISKISSDSSLTSTLDHQPEGYYSPENINRHMSHIPQYQNSQISGESFDEYRAKSKDGTTNNYSTPSDMAYISVSTTTKYEEPISHNEKTYNPSVYTEVSPITSDYEDIVNQKQHKGGLNQPELSYNHHQKEQKIESPYTYQQEADYSRELLNKEAISLQTNNRDQAQQYPSEVINTNNPYNGYITSNEEQNTTPSSQKSSYEPVIQDRFESYVHNTKAPKTNLNQNKQNFHVSPAENSEDYNERMVYDTKGSNLFKSTTERSTPTRSRSRGRVRTYTNKQTSTDATVSTGSNKESEENIHPSKLNTTSSPSRSYHHGRTHRRPLRPTPATTTTTTSSSPPGTKYLIRTRRPAVPQTKLQPGRGRIRRPTTHTTTLSTSTTEQTLPIPWQQPHGLSQSQHAYREKELSKQNYGADSTEHLEEAIHEYNRGKINDKRLYEPQNERNRNLNGPGLRQFDETDISSRTPNYSYDSLDENLTTQKQIRTTPQPYYAEEYESKPKHFSRNYGTTQKPLYFRNHDATKKTQYTQEYETTEQAQYTKDHELTPNIHYPPSDYDNTQRPHYLRDYETTQKTKYSKETETTQNPTYFKDYETTQNPRYFKDFETTPKVQYFKDYETTQKPFYYKEQETTQNLSNLKTHESDESPKYYDDYDDVKKPTYSDEYETRDKPKGVVENTYYSTTKKAANYKEYETTQRSYVSDIDTNQKQTYSHASRQPHRISNFRRRPSAVVTKPNPPKESKSSQDEVLKSPDSDFWNQAVTIQQSQSYVFNPDETYTDERPANPNIDSKYESTQNDYDDYYNQEREQPSSDQSPLPSNEQLITYTKIKERDYFGKPSQYPSKDDISFGNDTYKKEENDFNKSGPSIQKEIDDHKDVNIEYNSKKQKIFDFDGAALSSPKQGNKRRGTWVRRKIKKTKDLFETAESQSFGSVKENSLLPEFKSKQEQLRDNQKQLKVGEKEKTATLNTTSSVNLIEEFYSTTDRHSSEEPEHMLIRTTENRNEENDFTTETTTEIVTEGDTELNTEQTPSITTATQSDNKINEFSEPYHTSTTTEISLETEICYKGQCIKTKRRKEDKDTVLMSEI